MSSGLPKWVMGVTMNVAGQIAINLGTNLLKFGSSLQSSGDIPRGYIDKDTNQRLSFDDFDFEELDLEDLDPEIRKATIKARARGRWVKRVGAVTFIAGGVLNFVSFGYAAQSLLASLGSVQFVTNVIFGKFVLSERVLYRTWLATLVIVVGNCMIVYYSNRDSKEYTATELLFAYTYDYKWYCAAALFLLLIVSRIYNGLHRKISNLERNGLPTPRWCTTTIALCYAFSSAILGTQQMLQAKCLSELLRLTAGGHNQMANPFTYGVIFIYIVATVFWLYRMNTALQRYDGLFIIPVLQVFWLVFTIVSGGIYFQEFRTFSHIQMAGFVGGVLVVFLGVYLLMPEEDRDDHEFLEDKNFGNERDSDLFPDLDVEINEDFMGTRRRNHSGSDPSLPEGLPPLGEGIPGSHPRKSSVDSTGRPSAQQTKKDMKRAMPFGFYDYNKRSQTRLMSFGFMPVVSVDKKMNKFTDWTIERKKYWQSVQNTGKRIVKWTPLGKDKGSGNGLVELDELRRRTLTQDGVVDFKGRVVGGSDLDLKKINDEWTARTNRGGSTGDTPLDTSPVVDGRKKSTAARRAKEFARNQDHRRSFSQPPEGIAAMMGEVESWKVSPGKEGDDGEGDEGGLVLGNFSKDMQKMEMGGDNDAVRKDSAIDMVRGVFGVGDTDGEEEEGTEEETRGIAEEETEDEAEAVGGVDERDVNEGDGSERGKRTWSGGDRI